VLRLNAARAFLRALDRGAPALIVAPSPGAATWLVADVLEPGSACFGWRRRTLDMLANELALPVLARAEEVPVRRLGLEALCARVVHALSAQEALGRFSGLSRRPGFVRALASSLDELRLAGIGETGLQPHDPDMAKILGAYVASLQEAKLADRARVLEAAAERVRAGASAELGTALVMLDVPLVHGAEVAFAVALGERAASACVTVPLGDATTRDVWLAGCGERVIEQQLMPEGSADLCRLQRRLFEAEPLAEAESEPGDAPNAARGVEKVSRVIARPAENAQLLAGGAQLELTLLFDSPKRTAADSRDAGGAVGVASDRGALNEPAALGARDAGDTPDLGALNPRAAVGAGAADDAAAIASERSAGSVASDRNASEGEGALQSAVTTRLPAMGTANDAPSAVESSVAFASSPGESRECVEVARSILRAAESGVAFDRMAIAVRAVENYRAVLEEALTRARVPAHFADGVRRPAPEGRAFNALLTCAAEGLSARSFAEYLSIGVMPSLQPTAAGAAGLAGSAGVAAVTSPEAAPLVSPRRWERMILDAAVVGGRARWTRRLTGLLRGLRERASLRGADDPARERIALEIQQLESLQTFAFPVLDALAALPRSGTWRDWLDSLERLARLTLRDPDAVCETLAELAPLGPVGPVSLADVRRLLTPRLRSVVVPSTGTGAGQVFVGSIDELRGRGFTHVFVVGLAEKVFPARIGEDPLLPDRVRRALSPAPVLTADRIARERLALRLAVGAASERVVLSYPRFDLEHGRPRVPSFYGLEALQAICGELPAFDELGRRADPGAAPRLGWPAPSDPEHSIDDAEYDVAMLDRWRSSTEPNVGAARYLMQSNPHLARALRFRARRWQLPRFVAADGFVVSSETARNLLPAHSLNRRAHSASALAQFTACPYKFYLSALMRLAVPERIAEVDELDPRQRGILFHAVQREVVNVLQVNGLVPLTEADWPRARELLHAALDAELARAREAYAPAIERVFDVALGSLRSDLEGWLRTLSLDRDWLPMQAELEFGFERAGTPREAVLIEPGLLLSGAIDLVEQYSAPSEAGQRILRATDHKTGAVTNKLSITRGGAVLQPVLYALALERLFPDAAVRGGRLHFCTSRGRFEVQEVPLTDRVREISGRLIRSISSMLDAGFLPAAPDDGACEHCSYRVICGPYEEERVAAIKAKEAFRLDPLNQIRDLP
jgi:ATP-dependent helicase/nuclease subunit B